MKRFKSTGVALAAVAFLLSACKITVTPGPPPADYTVSANASPGTPVWSGRVAAGQWLNFMLTVPAGVSGSSDVVYIELNQDLDLELRNPTNYDIVASSSSARYYAPERGGLVITAADDIGAQAITDTVSCRGSCVIIPAGGSSAYYARVVNTGASASDVSLYFFGEAEMDESETNDSIATATLFDVDSATGDRGAIELMYDKDYWRASASGSIEFITSAGNPVDLRLEVVNGAGQRLLGPIGNGGTVSVITGDYLLVYSASNRAGAPAASQYTLLGGL
ncbi:MAG: hypothetical protein M9914_01870 [Trueperaceae bacterium]|nr:hypothetical protein [Trueperaceae bacterium]